MLYEMLQMAELVLTDEEKKTATYLEWDDAALGRACKKIALLFNDDNGKRAMKHTGAAVFLISEAVASNATTTTIELEGATDPEPLGDWRVTLERI